MTQTMPKLTIGIVITLTGDSTIIIPSINDDIFLFCVDMGEI